MRGSWTWGEVCIGILCLLVAGMALLILDLRRAVEAQRDIQKVQSRLLRQIAETFVCGSDASPEPLPTQEDER